MQIFYCKIPNGNFGDDLNEWIWDRLIPGWRSLDHDVTLVGVGTLLNDRNLRPLRSKRILVVGTGVGYGKVPEMPLDARWDFRAVRGVQSANLLGLDQRLGIADPALLLSDFAELKAEAPRGRALFVPHLGSVKLLDWGGACAEAGLDYINPQSDAKTVVRAISGASLVLAESMHAAIIADSFRVPWIPVKVSGHFNSAKWGDFFGAVHYPMKIAPLFRGWSLCPERLGPCSIKRLSAWLNSSQFKAMAPEALSNASRRTAFLSDDGINSRLKERFYNVLESVKRDYGSHG